MDLKCLDFFKFFFVIIYFVRSFVEMKLYKTVEVKYACYALEK